MNSTTAISQELTAKENGQITTKVPEIDSCPTCLSGIEASTLGSEYLEILKR